MAGIVPSTKIAAVPNIQGDNCRAYEPVPKSIPGSGYVQSCARVPAKQMPQALYEQSKIAGAATACISEKTKIRWFWKFPSWQILIQDKN